MSEGKAPSTLKELNEKNKQLRASDAEARTKEFVRQLLGIADGYLSSDLIELDRGLLSHGRSEIASYAEPMADLLNTFKHSGREEASDFGFKVTDCSLAYEPDNRGGDVLIFGLSPGVAKRCL